MEFEKLANLIKVNCPEILRTCWRPVIAEEPTSSRLTTKFAGSKPYKGTNFSWPRCREEGCGEQMLFICQINLGELPDQVKTQIGKDSGMFQCFFKICCLEDCDEDGVAEVRLIPSSEIIPSLQTLAAIAVFETKTNIDHLPNTMKKYIEETNEEFDFDDFEDSNSFELERKKHEIGLSKKHETSKKILEKFQVGEEIQIETWKESERKEIPMWSYMTDRFDFNCEMSQKILAVPGIDSDVLSDIECCPNKCRTYTNAEPIGSPMCSIKLGGYMAWFDWDSMGYDICSACDVAMDVTFLQLDFDTDYLHAFITLCPKCGKPNFKCYGEWCDWPRRKHVAAWRVM